MSKFIIPETGNEPRCPSVGTIKETIVSPHHGILAGDIKEGVY